jgi:CelD/BcsL family acetyltransferase involved in cellulose biosynthesis
MSELRLDDADPTGAREWRALALEASTVFGTPEWLTTWWRHYGGDRTPLATACRDATGKLLGVLPLYAWVRRPLRVLRFVGHGPGDALGPVCRPDARTAVASSLRVLLEQQGASLLVGECMPADEGWSERLGGVVLKREANLTLEFAGQTWDDFFASRSSNFRSSIRSKANRLGKRHRVTYRLADEPASFERDFDQFVALHRSRWPSGSSFTDAEPFHRDFASLASARGWCRLWFLEVDGEARAAWYGFRFAGVDYYYQAGRDPTWDGYSVGLLLHVHTIREAATDGVREYRFLRGDEHFKSRFASHDPQLETIAIGRTLSGKAAIQVSARLPRALLRRLA